MPTFGIPWFLCGVAQPTHYKFFSRPFVGSVVIIFFNLSSLLLPQGHNVIDIARGGGQQTTHQPDEYTFAPPSPSFLIFFIPNLQNMKHHTRNDRQACQRKLLRNEFDSQQPDLLRFIKNSSKTLTFRHYVITINLR